jgi:hypothetical protein
MTCWPPPWTSPSTGCAASCCAGGTPATPPPAGWAAARPGAGSPQLGCSCSAFPTPPGSRPPPGSPHIRAVLATRLWLQSGEVYQYGQAWWRSERRIRAATDGQAGTAHVPDAEVHWPSLDDSPYAGQIWAIEAELTPKPLPRTTAIMRELLTRTSDYGPAGCGGLEARYGQIVYLTAPAAAPIVTRAITELPAPLQARIQTRDLPPGATR